MHHIVKNHNTGIGTLIKDAHVCVCVCVILLYYFILLIFKLDFSFLNDVELVFIINRLSASART